MRLRVNPAEARKRLALAIESYGGRALTIGETLELSYPGDPHAGADQERQELTFFVRAWAAAEIGVLAEVLN
jgi:hypothetical protein